MHPSSNPLLKSGTLAATLALSLSANAATWQWDGGAGTGNWQTANNWNPNALNPNFNDTFADRLNVNGTQALIYTSAEGTTNYGSGSVRGLVVGSGGSGTMTITGGTFSSLNATGSNQDVIGNGDNSTGILNISGGTFIGAAAGTNLGLGGGTNRVSTLNLNSGLARIGTLNMNSGTATINLSGGTLEVNIITRTAGTANLNLSGGTLKARQNSTAFVTGLSAVNINSGGAIIDSNGFDITIGNILKDGGGGGGLTKNSAGTLTLTAVPTYTGSTAVNGGTLAYDLATDYTYGNTIGGAGSIAKSGAGTITLTNANTYLGATSITGGALALTGSGAINSTSGITLNGATARLNASGSSAVSPAVTLTNGTLTGNGTVNTVNVGAGTGGVISNNNGVAGAALNIGTLTLSGGANINLFSNGADTSSVLNITTLINNSSSNTVTLAASNALGWSNGATYTLIDYGTLGGTGGYNFSTLVNNLSGRQIGTFTDTGSAITLGITGDSVFWTGNANAKWNTADTNWELVAGATATQFIATDDVIFDDNASGNTTIDIDAANVATNTIIFNNSTSTSYTINSSGGYGISAGSLTKNNNGTVTISTANSHTGATTVNNGILRATTNAGALGAGSLTLTGGELQLANDTGLSFGRNTTVSGNAQITADTLTSGAGVTHSLGTLSIGANTLAIAKGANATGTTAGVTLGATTLTGDATLSIGADSTLTLGAVANGSNTATITGAGNFVQTGVWGNGSGGITFDSGFSGTATLSQANTFTGVTTISGGIVKAGNAAALGSTAGGTVINTGGTFDINGISLAGEAFTLAGGKLSNTGAEQINAIGGAVTVTADSEVGGSTRWDIRKPGSSLTVNSGVTLTKVDTNEFGLVGRDLVNNGLIQIDAGTFSIHTGGSYGGTGTYTVNANGNLSMGSYGSTSNVNLGNNITSNGGMISSVNSSGSTPLWTGQINLSTATTTTLNAIANGTISGNIVGGGGLDKTGGATFTLSGTNSYTGPTQVTTGTLVLSGSFGSTTITVNSGTVFSQTAAGSIGGTASLTTSGTTTLAGTNSYSGATTVNAGVLTVSSSTGLGNSTAIAVNAGRLALDGNIVLGSGATATIKGSGDNFYGALQGNNGTNEWQGNVTIGAAGTRIGVNSGVFTVSGVIDSGANAYGVTLRPNAGTVLFLSGANTYLGDTSIITSSGNVRLIGGDNRLPTGTKLLFGTGSTSGILDLNGQDQEVAGLSVVGGSNNEIKSATGATLTVNTATASSWGGIITGAAGLTKTGPDILTLTNANTYAGNTLVSGGVLEVDGSLANTSTTIVNTGMLRGSGSIGGSVTVQNGGTFAAGNSIESLATGSLKVEAGGTFAYEIDNDADPTVAGDLTAVTGDFTLDTDGFSLLTIGELGAGEWSIGEKLTLISYTGSWNGGLFEFQSRTLADNSTLTFSGMEWFFNYDDDSAGTNYTGDLTGSSFVTMTVIPEPGAALLGGLGLLALLRRRRNA